MKNKILSFVSLLTLGISLAIFPLPLLAQEKAPIDATYTVTSSSITFSIINNGSNKYAVTGDLLKGSNSVGSIVFGDLDPAQKSQKTVTALSSNTVYELYIRAYPFKDGQPSTQPQVISFPNIKTSTSTGQGIGGNNNQGIGGNNNQGIGGNNNQGIGGKDNAVTEGLGLDNPLNGVSSIEDFVAKALNVVVDIGTPLVAFFLILSGFMFVAARGNEEKLQTAKRSLVYTLIGAALILGCWGIAQAIKGTVQNVTQPTSYIQLEKNA